MTFGFLAFFAFHDALDGALAEVVGVGFHREAIDADGDVFLLGVVPLVAAVVGIVSGFAKDLVGDEVLAGAVGLDDGGHLIPSVLIVTTLWQDLHVLYWRKVV